MRITVRHGKVESGANKGCCYICKREKTALIREAKKAGRAEVSSDKSSRKSDMCQNLVAKHMKNKIRCLDW